jgi:molybdopterin biosynthesis enzyme
LVSRVHVADDAARTRDALRAACAAGRPRDHERRRERGEADHLPGAVAALGEIVFWKVRMRPGMPALFGLIDGKPVFALPGNPVSVFATFLALVRPALAALAGCAALDRRRCTRGSRRSSRSATRGWSSGARASRAATMRSFARACTRR